MDDSTTIILVVFGAIFALSIIISLALIAFGVAAIALRGFLNLLAWASENGTQGLILYLLLWIFLTPVMIIVSLINGYISTNDDE